MNGAHDMGGMHGFGPVQPGTDEPVFHSQWEARVFALSLAAPGGPNIDAFRHTNENRPPADYLSSSYYQKWLWTLEDELVQYGFVTSDELKEGHPLAAAAKYRALKPGEIEKAIKTRHAYDRDASSAPLYSPGQKIRTRNIHPRGHTRLPRYARSREGTIIRVHGCHPFPDSNAHGKGEDPHWLYGVAFAAQELWGGDAESGDEVNLDLWEPYLEAA